MSDLIVSDNKTMSSREIAELTGKKHSNVCRDIRKQLSELGIGEFKFESSYISAQGKQVTEYILDKEQTMTLVSGYSIPLRHKVVSRWLELESGKGLSDQRITEIAAKAAAAAVGEMLPAIFKRMDAQIENRFQVFELQQEEARQLQAPPKVLPHDRMTIIDYLRHVEDYATSSVAFGKLCAANAKKHDIPAIKVNWNGYEVNSWPVPLLEVCYMDITDQMTEQLSMTWWQDGDYKPYH